MYQYVLFLLPLNYKIESNSQLKADAAKVYPRRLLGRFLAYLFNIKLRQLIAFCFPFRSIIVAAKDIIQFHACIVISSNSTKVVKKIQLRVLRYE